MFLGSDEGGVLRFRVMFFGSDGSAVLRFRVMFLILDGGADWRSCVRFFVLVGWGINELFQLLHDFWVRKICSIAVTGHPIMPKSDAGNRRKRIFGKLLFVALNA